MSDAALNPAALAEAAAAVDGPAFSTRRFRAEREGDWTEFERLLTMIEKGSSKSLSSDELLQLPVLYRATLSSLSIARATSLDRAMLDYLEGLAKRGYFVIYGVRTTRMKRLGGFFAHDWPVAIRSLWKETIIIALVIILGMATSWALVASDPQWFYQFVPEGMSGGRDPNATAEFLRDTIFDKPDGAPLHTFATFLFTHNSQVSILSFALGFAFGLPTMMLEYYQGLTLGAMVAVFAGKGLGVEFGGWLFIHGTTELFAAALSGAAGLRIGTAVVFPGAEDRLTAAAKAGRTAGTAMVGVIIMLMVAGLLEGFGRQLITDTGVRYAIGGLMLTLWCGYFYIPWRRRA